MRPWSSCRLSDARSGLRLGDGVRSLGSTCRAPDGTGTRMSRVNELLPLSPITVGVAISAPAAAVAPISNMRFMTFLRISG